MGYYLLDNRNKHGSHFYSRRNKEINLFVIHITAGLEDLDGADDHSAENTARYAATTATQVSWHSGSDTDSFLQLLPDEYTAFHSKNYNSRSIGHEISKKHTDWRTMSDEWIERTLRQAAFSIAPRAKKFGLPFRYVSRPEADRGVRGFTSHGVLDPSRRTDPGLVRGVGDTFPWETFFTYCTEVITPVETPLVLQEVNMSALPILSIGSRGEDVETIQALLIARDLMPFDRRQMDGIFGRDTENAVKQAQFFLQLPQSGVVDEPTWRGLVRVR